MILEEKTEAVLNYIDWLKVECGCFVTSFLLQTSLLADQGFIICVLLLNSTGVYERTLIKKVNLVT